MIEYANNAGNGEKYDFKERGMSTRAGNITPDQHRYRGNVDKNGALGSARDFGNIGAGIVAGRNNLTWKGARFGFDAYQSYTSGKITTEGTPTQKAQKVGYKIGLRIPEPTFNRFGEP